MFSCKLLDKVVGGMGSILMDEFEDDKFVVGFEDECLVMEISYI